MFYFLSKSIKLTLTILSLSSLRLNHHAVMGTTSPDEEDPLDRFNYNLIVRKGIAKVAISKSCRWLSRQKDGRRIKICEGGLEYPGSGSAAETCPITCAEQVERTPFFTYEQLQAELQDYCTDPEAWMLSNDYDKYGPIEEWDVSQIDSMNQLFMDQRDCNPDIGDWDVSSVTSFRNMFFAALSFNQDISLWDVSSSTEFYHMFSSAFIFNQDISSWDVSNARTLQGMFSDARAFNQDISSWDVSNSESFSGMFFATEEFNQELSSWDVSSSTSFRNMFSFAHVFNQDVCSWNWDISPEANVFNFCNSVTASCGPLECIED